MAEKPHKTQSKSSAVVEPLPDAEQFVHLHLHTEYSLLDGGNRVDKLVRRVKELGMTAVGMTDHGNMFGAVSFYLTCRDAGIKPILGVEAYVTPPGKPRQDRTYTGGGEGGYHTVLLAENLEGWNNLLVLCSEAYLTGFYYKPRIDRELLEKHSAGLIAINGHLGSEIGDHLLDYERTGDEKHWAAAVESARWHARVFGGRHGGTEARRHEGEEGQRSFEAAADSRFFIELQHHIQEQNSINKHLIRLAEELGLPVVCDNDSHFLRAEDHDAHDTLICISTGKAKSDAQRMKYPAELYVKSPGEMREMFAQYGDVGRIACDNTLRIAARCNVELPLGKNHAPLVRVSVPAEKDLPRHDDAKYGGDLTAWYTAYCACFEVKPFKEEPTEEQLAAAKEECDRALTMLAEAGAVWRYGPGILGRSDLRADRAASDDSQAPAPQAERDGSVTEGLPLAALEAYRKRHIVPAGFVPRDPYPEGIYGAASDLIRTKRNLPHLELPGATYFVTWSAKKGQILDDHERTLVMSALRHFDGDRCRVYCATVMPDHIHWIVRPHEGVRLRELTASVKRFSATKVNENRGRKGSFWQEDDFDHIVRDGTWFTEFLWYMLDNPVEAGIVASPAEYPWTFVHADVLRGPSQHVADNSAAEAIPLCADAAQVGSEIRPTQDGADAAEIRARLERELKILIDKKIAAYFLIVWDFVNWGRQNGVPALARGSGVGTMVGYVLGLSNACPVRYGLLFERFTDPDRSEYPDIDIDLCQDGRGRVIDYVRTKYGHVAQIITFGTMKARAAIRDVARVLEIPLAEADKLAKMVPEALGITLDKALDESPDLKKLYEEDERVQRLIDNARTLEGQARHSSVHAAGVIVATRPLHEVVPLYKQPGAQDQEIVTQWDGPTCEKMGLLKMDFLGLRTISVIERAKQLIRNTLPEAEIWRAIGRTPGTGTPHPLDLDRLTYDDQRVFDMFRRGETTGVFQFESPGMRRLLTDMKPDRLEDLIAANALFRPGPMDLIPDYNRRKHGTEQVPKIHPIVDRYTDETYGVMVYQEQVMQIVHGLGGIKLRDAYALIKNISKKKHDKIEKERPKFVEGAQKQGLSKEGAQELFELILKFAGYGFNKSHSTGYAIVAYQTAYLKTYFPNQYMAAFLTFESAANKVSDWIPYLEDCKKTRFIEPLPDGKAKEVKVGVEVRPPDVNLSQSEFTVVFEENEARTSHGGHVRFGLRAIKGAGEKAIEAIIAERDGTGRHGEGRHEGGEARRHEGEESGEPVVGGVVKPYTSIFDFCERVLTRGVAVNKATIEALVKSGAFDRVHSRAARAAVCATIEQAISAAQKAAKDKAAGQGALFGFGGGEPASGPASNGAAPGAATPLASASAWSEADTLAKEKEVLGFYVSSHPLERWSAWMQAFLAVPTAEVRTRQPKERILLGGMVQAVRTIVIKNGRMAGQKMAVITFEDRTGTVEAVLFSDQYVKYGHLMQGDAQLFLIGDVDLSRGEPQIIIDRALPIECVPKEPLRTLDLLIDGVKMNGTCLPTMERVAELLAACARGEGPETTLANPPKPVPVRVFVNVEYAPQPVPISMGEGWRVQPTPELLSLLRRLLGDGCYRIGGQLLPRDREEQRERWGSRQREMAKG